jgi:hypothetical protein
VLDDPLGGDLRHLFVRLMHPLSERRLNCNR